MEFDVTEKYAIIRTLERVAKADNRLEMEEMDMLIRVTGFLNMSSSDVYNAKELSFDSVREIISNMEEPKKDYLKQMLLELSNSDHNIDTSELKIILEIIL